MNSNVIYKYIYIYLYITYIEFNQTLQVTSFGTPVSGSGLQFAETRFRSPGARSQRSTPAPAVRFV